MRRRAYSRWSHWVRECEANTLRLADKLDENGEGKRKYLEVRKRVREGEDVDGGDREVLEMAQTSIRSVKWR